MLPYYLLITGLVHQQWSLSVIHAQFVQNLAEMKGKSQVHFIFALPLPQVIIFSFFLNLSLFKAFQLYFQWEDGGGPEKDQTLLLELVLHNLTLGNLSLSSSSLLLSVTGAGLVSAFLSSFSSFSPSLLLDFLLPT